jgi:hypothetical protein
MGDVRYGHQASNSMRIVADKTGVFGSRGQTMHRRTEDVLVKGQCQVSMFGV